MKMLKEKTALRKWTNIKYVPPRFSVTAYYRDIDSFECAVRAEERERAVLIYEIQTHPSNRNPKITAAIRSSKE